MRLCQECYATFHPQLRGFERKVRWHGISSRLHGFPIHVRTMCGVCGKIIMCARAADECRECIEAYLNKEREFARFNRWGGIYEMELHD